MPVKKTETKEGIDQARLAASIKALEQQQSKQREELQALKKENADLRDSAKQASRAGRSAGAVPEETDPVKRAEREMARSRRDFLESPRPRTEFFSFVPRYSLVIFPDQRTRDEITGQEQHKPGFTLETDPHRGVGAELKDHNGRPEIKWGHTDLSAYSEIQSGLYDVEVVLSKIQEIISKDEKAAQMLMTGEQAREYLVRVYNTRRVAEEADRANREMLESVAPGAHKGGHFHTPASIEEQDAELNPV